MRKQRVRLAARFVALAVVSVWTVAGGPAMASDEAAPEPPVEEVVVPDHAAADHNGAPDHRGAADHRCPGHD